ncbi:phosphate transporter [Pseudohyphozyma bogoriensis]|nr:phosphate transporter [Pseudohyphozyma bogoriensis]
MKFSHSLLFNSVPEWSSHYLNYEALKSAIYRFEKASLVAGPPTSYTDDDPSALEAGANSSEIHSANTNEKVFTRLLDQELHKITEFYVDKERELLADLVVLQADIERIEEEDSHASGGRGISGASSEDGGDDDDESGDDDETTVASRIKGAITNVFSNPTNYDAATRAGRRARFGRSVSRDGAGKRKRALSSASAGSDLLDLAEEDVDAAEGSHQPLIQTTTNSNQPDASNGTSGAPPTPSRKALQRNGSRLSAVGTPGSARGRRGLSMFRDDDEDGVWGGTSDWAIDTRIMYKRRITAVFTALSELKQYVNLNYTGLSKVLKKYDKITNSSLRSKYMSTVVDHTFPFETQTQDRLTSSIQSLIPLYADIATGGDEDAGLKQLKAHLREHVVWERNTVWREMIGLERKGWSSAGPTGGRSGVDVPIVDGSKGEVLLGAKETGFFPQWLSSQMIAGAVAVVLFLGIINAEWFDRVEEQNCLALLVFVTIFWALEIIPLFVTALTVPFFVVVLRVLRSTDGEDRRLTSSEATKYIFGQMFSPTIMLLLGGFTLAAALSKQNIDKVLATKVLSLAGTKPRNVLLAYMCVACFASMWISNVAAPVLCYSLIQPILRTLPSKAPFSKSLILGIALASNIGGMASPISSPQNLIAVRSTHFFRNGDRC